jgi:hypothetical protein
MRFQVGQRVIRNEESISPLSFGIVGETYIVLDTRISGGVQLIQVISNRGYATASYFIPLKEDLKVEDFL